MNSINRKSAFPSTITHLLFIRLANYSLKFTSAAFRSPARAPCNPLLQSFILVTGNRRHPHQLRSAHGMAEQGSEDQVRPFSIPTYFTVLVTKNWKSRISKCWFLRWFSSNCKSGFYHSVDFELVRFNLISFLYSFFY